MSNLLTLLLLVATAAPGIRVTTLDEAQVAGELVSWTAKEVSLQQADKPLPDIYSPRQLLRVDIEQAPNRGGTEPRLEPGVEISLVEGSSLTGADFRSTGATATFDGAVVPSLEIPLDVVRSVRLANLAEEEAHLASRLEAEWQEILATESAGDLIVIRKPGADGLSYIEGVLGDVGAQSVQFTLDGSTLKVNRTKVFGVVYYHVEEKTQGAPAGTVVEGEGLRLFASQIVWDSAKGEGEWVVETPLLGSLRLPASAIQQVDYSSGRLLYLSDLEPVRSEWRRPPGTFVADPRFMGLARDRGFYSPELELEYPASSLSADESTSAGIPRRKAFKKGLALRSYIEQTYRIPQGFTRFRATAGIDPRTQATGHVELRVLGDGRELFKRSIRGGEAPVELECEVTGLKELTIVVDFGADDPLDMGAGDNLHLAGARLTQ